MQRRSWLKLGVTSAALIGIGGGLLATIQPGLTAGKLSASSRPVLLAVGAALLDGSLPTVQPERQVALEGMILRVESLISGLPAHSQTEVQQLLTMLGHSIGRYALAGLNQPWEAAPVDIVQTSLNSMRFSSLSLRQQAYQALHDIVGSAYFSDASAWVVLGYPGPVKIS